MENYEQQYHYATLPNGLRIVAHYSPDSVAEHCGVAVRAGSRDERPEHYGLAHFVEHTIFKGTLRRKSWHILNRMERVGGELNAYTTKEETVVYSTYPAGYASRAMELIADLVENSRFPTQEIDKERQVVADEIDSYLDIPSEGIFDDFEELVFAGSALAHPILGSRESLERLTSEVCREYLSEYYRPDNMVFFYWGAERPERVFKMATKFFTRGIPQDRLSRTPLGLSGVRTFNEVRETGSHQAHTVLGARIHDMYSPDRYNMALLTNMLGGPGMNSLLNVALREKRGLVYTVEASTALLTDTGLFTVYYGCDPEDVERCHRLVTEAIHRLASRRLTPRQLEDARRQYIGQLMIASTNTEQRALSMARSTLLRGSVISREETLRRLQEITPDSLSEAASRLTDLSRLTLR